MINSKVGAAGTYRKGSVISDYDPLVKAAKKGDVEGIRRILEACLPSRRHDYLNAKSSSGWTALFHPVWAGSIAAAKELLESGADPNAQNIHFNSPLHLACQRGNKSMIDLLIHAGANCNLENADCATCCDVIEPLKKPKLYNHIKLLERQREQDETAKMAAVKVAPITALMKACQDGNASSVLELVQQFPPHKRPGVVNAADADGNTPLAICAMSGNEQPMRVLLDLGADPNAQVPPAHPPACICAAPASSFSSSFVGHFRRAARTGEATRPCISAAIPPGRRPTLPRWAKESRGALAARGGGREANTSESGREGGASHYWEPRYAVGELLLKYGALVTSKNKRGRYAWQWAGSSEEESRHVGDWLRGSNAAMGQDFWAKIMREKRVAEAKKARNKLNGCRQPLSSSDPLLRAAHSGDESKIRELLDFVKEKACKNRVQELMAAGEPVPSSGFGASSEGAKTKKKDKKDKPPEEDPAVAMALYASHPKVQQAGLEAVQDYVRCAEKRSHRTAVFYTLTPYPHKKSHLECLDLLLRVGADPLHRDSNGETPLHLCCERNLKQAVRKLLQHTSDVSVRSVEGKLAHEMGSTSKDQKSMMLFIKSNLDERAWLQVAVSQLQDPAFVGRPLTPEHPVVRALQAPSPTERVLLLNKQYLAVKPFLRDIFFNARDRDGNSILHLACRGHHVEVVEWLLRHGAHPDAINHHTETALHMCCGQGDGALVRALVLHGATPDILNKQGKLCWEMADSGVHVALNALIKQARAEALYPPYVHPSVDMEEEEETLDVALPFFVNKAKTEAVATGHGGGHKRKGGGGEEAKQQPIWAGIDFKEQEEEKVNVLGDWDGLVEAAALNSLDTVDSIMGRVPPFKRIDFINTANSAGQTPLTLVCRDANVDSVDRLQKLLEWGADPNTRDPARSHWAPLHYVCARQVKEGQRALMEGGADPSLETKDDEYAWELGKKQGAKMMSVIMECVLGGGSEKAKEEGEIRDREDETNRDSERNDTLLRSSESGGSPPAKRNSLRLSQLSKAERAAKAKEASVVARKRAHQLVLNSSVGAPEGPAEPEIEVSPLFANFALQSLRKVGEGSSGVGGGRKGGGGGGVAGGLARHATGRAQLIAREVKGNVYSINTQYGTHSNPVPSASPSSRLFSSPSSPSLRSGEPPPPLAALVEARAGVRARRAHRVGKAGKAGRGSKSNSDRGRGGVDNGDESLAAQRWTRLPGKERASLSELSELSSTMQALAQRRKSDLVSLEMARFREEQKQRRTELLFKALSFQQADLLATIRKKQRLGGKDAMIKSMSKGFLSDNKELHFRSPERLRSFDKHVSRAVMLPDQVPAQQQQAARAASIRSLHAPPTQDAAAAAAGGQEPHRVKPLSQTPVIPSRFPKHYRGSHALHASRSSPSLLTGGRSASLAERRGYPVLSEGAIARASAGSTVSHALAKQLHDLRRKSRPGSRASSAQLGESAVGFGTSLEWGGHNLQGMEPWEQKRENEQQFQGMFQSSMGTKTGSQIFVLMEGKGFDSQRDMVNVDSHQPPLQPNTSAQRLRSLQGPVAAQQRAQGHGQASASTSVVPIDGSERNSSRRGGSRPPSQRGSARSVSAVQPRAPGTPVGTHTPRRETATFAAMPRAPPTMPAAL